MAVKRQLLVAAGIAAIAAAIAWYFCFTTLRHTYPMALPLDDSYIYLTYAKQFGRAQPFTYFPGGGYSAGSTSVLWPMLLAPFWTLGARGHALVWVSYIVSAVLYALTALGVWRIVRRIAGELAGAVAPLLLLAIAPFAWTSLSGMEVAFASTLLVATILLLLDQPKTGPPRKRLAVCLAALSLSRPEATLLVLAIIAVAVIQRRRQLRSAAWWLVPLVAPIAWLTANKLLAGNFFPNTGVAKSHFYLPGFDWTYWREAVVTLTGRMLRGMFWDTTSPLVWPRMFAIAWVVGAVRVIAWARRERQWLAGVVIVAAPFVLMLAVIASSGLWSFQNYRYIAPAFPFLAITAGCALVDRGTTVIALALAEGVFVLAIGLHAAPPVGLVLVAAACASPITWIRRDALAVIVVLFVRDALPGLRGDANLFAQGAMDANTQVVAIGEYIHRKLPDATVMFHDAGAIAYFGDGRVYDMLGLVTNHQAGIANNGPGARFEFLESLPPDQRPTHFAYYPAWMGTSEWYGEVLLHTPLQPGFEPRRLVGDSDMQVIVASFDHAGTGERPLLDHTGWAVVDRLDVADLASERAHAWWPGALGRRNIGDPTARWSFVGRETGLHGLVLDGGRTIRGGGERFTLALDPAKPTHLVLRTGGARTVPFQEPIDRAVELSILDADDRVLATATLPVPTDTFQEVTFTLPAGVTGELHTRASNAYRVFHWFALQPE